MRNVKIKITGIQTIDGESDKIEFISDGIFGTNENGFYLKYTEGELVGESKTNTEFILENEKTAILNRTGGMSSRLIISEGKRNNCFYSTAEGALTIGIYSESVAYRLTDIGGEINLKYTIDSNMTLLSENEVNIKFREFKNK